MSWFGWSAAHHRPDNKVAAIEYQVGHFNVIVSLRMIMRDGIRSPLFGGGCGCGCDPRATVVQAETRRVNFPQSDRMICSYRVTYSAKGCLLSIEFIDDIGMTIVKVGMGNDEKIVGSKEEVIEIGHGE